MIGKRYEPKDILALDGIPREEVLGMLDGEEITRDNKTILKIAEIIFGSCARAFVYSGDNKSHDIYVPFSSNNSFYGSIDRVLTDYSKNPDLYFRAFAL